MRASNDLSWAEAILMALSGLAMLIGTFGLLLRVYSRSESESYQCAVRRSRPFVFLVIISFLAIAVTWAASFFT